jgi:hypothetical protein
MRPNPRRMADVIRMPGVQGGPAPAAATGSVARPEVVDPGILPEVPPEIRPEETVASAPPATLSRDSISSRIEMWQAPILSDEIVDTMATIFLMHPGHELMPFFLWLEGKIK